MRCCICASAYKTFTTNLRKREFRKTEFTKTDLKKVRGTEHGQEMEIDFYHSDRDSGDGAVRLPRRRTGHAPLELAVAAALRMAHGYVLAGTRHPDAVPHPFRRIWTPSSRPLQIPPSSGRARGRALREYDAGRARTVPPT